MAATTSTSTVGTSESMFLDFNDFEEGISGNGAPSMFQYHSMSTQSVGSDMRFYFDQSRDGRSPSHHICDTCYLCKGDIRKDQEIYMYRGDLPFCSQECRWEQIEMDLALERLHYQTQKKNQKLILVPVNQNECSRKMDSCTESGYGDFGLDVVKYIVSLVVG